MRLLLRPLAAALACAALALGLAACDSSDGGGDAPAAARFVYVTNQGDASVSVIDPATNTVVETVDLTARGFSAQAKPHDVAVEPDGAAWYVTLIGENRVVKFDAATNEVVGAVPFEAPGMLALHPTAPRLYAAHTMSVVDVPPTALVLDRATMTPRAAGDGAVALGIERPHAVAVGDRGVAYAGSLSQNRIATLTTDDDGGRADVPVRLGGATQRYVQFALAPDGSALYATAQTANQLLRFDLADPAAPTLAATYDVGPAPWHPTFGPDGRTLYFGNKGANTVTAFDTQTGTATVIADDAFAQPHGSALGGPGGRFLYVSNNNTADGTNANGRVVAIDTQTNAVAAVIEVGRNPTGVGSPRPE